MAHIGQEIRLGAARRFCVFLGFLEFFGSLFRCRNVGEVTIPDPAAMGQLAWMRFPVHPDNGARVLVHHSEIYGLSQRVRVGNAQRGSKQRPVIRMHPLRQ